MNSKQRRARIRAVMPDVVHRILTMKLMGDMSSTDAERLMEVLRDPQIKLRDFEAVVRTVAVAERDVELRTTFKTYITSRTGCMQSNTMVLQNLPRAGRIYFGASPHTIIIDEVTQIK